MMFDDWDISNVFVCSRRVVRAPSNFLRVEKHFPCDSALEARPYLSQYVEILVDLVEGRGHRIALPLFPWRDPSLLTISEPYAHSLVRSIAISLRKV